MNNHYKLVIELCEKCGPVGARKHVELYTKLRELNSKILVERRQYRTKLDNLNGDIRKLMVLCDHPITYLDSGDGYLVPRRWCRVCGGEVHE